MPLAGSVVRWRACGDAAALAEVGDLDVVLRLHAAAAAAREGGHLPDVADLVPAARTLLVRCASRKALERSLEQVAELDLPETIPADGDQVTVEVSYDGEDLDHVAELLGCAAAEVVRRHVETPWRVAFTGFAPGFGYLVPDLDPATPHPLEVPRRGEARTEVPAGAVGLAGEFTGVYPRVSPGGWQLIGTAVTTTFDATAEVPALLSPGTRVRFGDTGSDSGDDSDPGGDR